MAVLTINGWEVPVALDSAELGDDDVGSSERGANGYLHTHRFLDAETIRGELSLSTPEEGRAFRGLIKGRGERFAFDRMSAFLPSLYSSKHRAPVTNGGYSGHESETVVYEYDAVTPALPVLGDSCIGLYVGTTNKLTSAQAQGTSSAATTGFTAIDGATLTSDTGTFRQGTRSLKVVTSAVANAVRGGVLVDAVAATGDTWYTGSVYLRAASGSPQVRVWMQDDFGTIGTHKAVTLSATAWKRVCVKIYTDATATTVDLRIAEETIDAGVTFFADMLQIEAHEFATGWVDGVRAASNLSYLLGEQREHDELTIMMWARREGDVDNSTEIGSGAFFEITDGAGSYLRAYMQIDPEVITQYKRTNDSSASQFSNGGTPPDPMAWHWYAWTIHRSLDSQPLGISVRLYIDGVLSASSTDPQLPYWRQPTLYVGQYADGSLPWNGQMDELVVLPWAATAEQIASFYSIAFSDLPSLNVAGVAITGTDEPVVEMVGSIDKDPLRFGIDGGLVHQTMRSIGFTLKARGS